MVRLILLIRVGPEVPKSSLTGRAGLVAKLSLPASLTEAAAQTVARAVVLAEAGLVAFRTKAALLAQRLAAYSAESCPAFANPGDWVAGERVLVLAVALLIAVEAETAW